MSNPNGGDFVNLAATKLGQKYENILVPKNNPTWQGPWDCAEFVSWVAYQVTGKLYGCDKQNRNPATTEAYSGFWVDEAVKAGSKLKVAEAAITAGSILIRKSPAPKVMGHVAISDGAGGTIEAAGVKIGVIRGKVSGRDWTHCMLLPNVDYSKSSTPLVIRSPGFLLKLKKPNMAGDLVNQVQTTLKAAGFDPGVIDGQYGPHTVAAVSAFQSANRLVADGVVGGRTATKLGILWP